MQNRGEWVRDLLGISSLQTQLLGSLIVGLTLWLLRRLFLHIVLRRTDSVGRRYQWRKTSAYVTAFLAFLVISPLWVGEPQSAATYLGLLSAGLAIALREPVTNLAGWAFILWRRPFRVGDRIQIGLHAGDVVDIRLFQFTLLEIENWVAADQSTGRVMHVPNGRVFSDVVANYSSGFDYVWNEMPVRVTFESDWEAAKAILQQIADRHAETVGRDAAEQLRKELPRFMILYSTLTPTVYTRVDAYAVLLTIRYLCKPRRRRSTEHAIWEDILRAFAQHPEIEFAYPTRRFYHRGTERQGDLAEGLRTPSPESRIGGTAERPS